MTARGIPVQELPENQDPSVAYNLIEQTGEKIPLEIPTVEVEEMPKRRGRKPRAEESAEVVLEETPAEE